MRWFAYALAAVSAAGSPSPARADEARPSFLNEVVPVLTRAGCNQGACHGKGAGQNGFRLSLRGYAPEQDHRWLTREFDGRLYVMERAIRGDYSIVKAWKGDRFGNLVYRHTAMNFNPMIATAGKITIAEVEEIVEVGELDPDHIHTPGIFVHRIFEGKSYEKRIERRTVSK